MVRRVPHFLMRQFDVFSNPHPRSARLRPYLVVLQHDRIDDIRSVIVAPCAAAEGRPASPRISPAVTIRDRPYLVLVSELAPMQRAALTGRPVANLDADSYEILLALDFLFTGV